MAVSSKIVAVNSTAAGIAAPCIITNSTSRSAGKLAGKKAVVIHARGLGYQSPDSFTPAPGFDLQRPPRAMASATPKPTSRQPKVRSIQWRSASSRSRTAGAEKHRATRLNQPACATAMNAP